MRKLWGNIVYGFGKFVDITLGGLVSLVELITNLGDGLLRAVFPFIILMILGAFVFPPLLLMLLTPMGLSLILIVLLLFLIPFLGRGALLYLNRVYYVATNYYYDYAEYYRSGKKKNKTFSEYSERYTEELNRKFEEERRRAEEERRKRQEAENERWRKFFEENFRQYQGSYQQGGYNRTGGSTSYNPFGSFKKQYEDACDVLGVPYTASFAEIKKAYRNMAKKYHPDLSKERNAEEMFKRVNNAFDFLSEENVARYKQL